MIKPVGQKIHAMEELSLNSPQVGTIEDLSASDLRVLVFVLIERIKRIEKATEEKAEEYRRRLEGLPENYVSTGLYDRDIKVIQDNVQNLSSWKENTMGSAKTVATLTNLAVALFGGVFGAAITFIARGTFTS